LRRHGFVEGKTLIVDGRGYEARAWTARWRGRSG
jgi:hypothetical protein